MAERNPRVYVSLPVGTMEQLERYAKARKSKPTTEAMLILSQRLDELEDAGKIPSDNNAESPTTNTAGLLANYLKLLASGSSVPDEIIQLLAKETELTEEELRRIRDTCVAQAKQQSSNSERSQS